VGLGLVGRRDIGRSAQVAGRIPQKRRECVDCLERERRVGGPGLQGELLGWAVRCRPGALTGRFVGVVPSPGDAGFAG